MLSFTSIRYLYTPCIRIPLLHLGHQNKQGYVLLILIDWALKQLEGNGATDYGNPLSIV